MKYRVSRFGAVVERRKETALKAVARRVVSARFQGSPGRVGAVDSFPPAENRGLNSYF